jgi:hypothetical protein
LFAFNYIKYNVNLFKNIKDSFLATVRDIYIYVLFCKNGFLRVNTIANEQFFSYIMVRTSYILIRWWLWWFLCTRKKTCYVVSLALSHCNNSPWVDMSLHTDTLFWFWANHSMTKNAFYWDNINGLEFLQSIIYMTFYSVIAF